MSDRLLTRDGEAAPHGPLIAVNNTWNRRALVNGLDYTQSVEVPADGGPVVLRWDWPEDPLGVRAYPELLAGRKPWGGLAGGDLLPAPLDAARALDAVYDVAPSGDPAGFRVTFDLWISSDPEGGPEAITQEIMVHLTAAAAPPAGAPVGRLELGPLSGPLWVREGMGATGWTYLALAPEAAPLAGRLPLGPLIDALQAEDRLPPDAWLMTVELGAEVISGSGTLVIRDFALTPAATEARVGLPPPLPVPADLH